MKTIPFVLAAIPLLCLSIIEASAKIESTPALQTANTPTAVRWTGFAGADASGTIGWKFTVGSEDLTLTALGVYDHGGNNLAISHTVGIWDSDENLLRSVMVYPANSSTLVGSFRYENVTELTLEAGQSYVVGAYYGINSTDYMIYSSDQTFDPRITYVDARQRAPLDDFNLEFPSSVQGLNHGLFGPNFQVQIPEPSTWIFISAGVAFLGGRRLRSKK